MKNGDYGDMHAEETAVKEAIGSCFTKGALPARIVVLRRPRASMSPFTTTWRPRWKLTLPMRERFTIGSG